MPRKRKPKVKPRYGREPEYKGIYSIQEEICGCLIKKYFGGKVIRLGCDLHRRKIWFECYKCKKKMSKVKLKEHQWEHAV